MKKIMLVDDNHIAVDGLEANINWKILGAEVARKHFDAFSALHDLAESGIELIISDIDMPGMNGIEFSRRALLINPFFKIILISAYDTFEYAKQAVRLGAFDYIEKPIDYSYLTEVVKKAFVLIEIEKKHLALLEESKPAITSDFFHKLLSSRKEDARFSLSTYPDYLDLHLNCHYYLTLYIEISNASHIKSKIGIREYHVYLMTLAELIQNLGQSLNLCYLVNDLNTITCILGHNYSRTADFKKEVYQITDSLANLYHNKLFQIQIGIGCIVKDLWDLSVSYQTAKRALEYRFFLPQKTIFDVGDIPGQNFSTTLHEENKEEELIQLICKKDQAAISQWLETFFQELLRSYKTKDLVFMRIYSILGRILKFLYEMGIENSDLEEEIIKVYSNLNLIHNSPEFIAWLESICQNTCTKLENSVKTYQEKLCETVLVYIRKNYENAELGLNEIAGYVNVSPAHLSALYKKSSGLGISDVITSVRIDSACQLLRNTNLSLKEISEKIGYTNQYYFSSCFKKKVGQTPSSYRLDISIP